MGLGMQDFSKHRSSLEKNLSQEKHLWKKKDMNPGVSKQGVGYLSKFGRSAEATFARMIQENNKTNFVQQLTYRFILFPQYLALKSQYFFQNLTLECTKMLF